MAFSVKKVVVVGGIHGNEMGGIYAIKKWLSQGSSSPKELQRFVFLIFNDSRFFFSFLYKNIQTSMKFIDLRGNHVQNYMVHIGELPVLLTDIQITHIILTTLSTNFYHWSKNKAQPILNFPIHWRRPGLEDVRAVLANPLAVEKCLRFVHSDLNAAFDQSKWQRHKNDQEEPMVYDNEAGRETPAWQRQIYGLWQGSR